MIRRDYNDFIMREVSMLVKFLAKTILQKDTDGGEIILYDYVEVPHNTKLDIQLETLVKTGQINQAENELFEQIKADASEQNFASAVRFYLLLNGYDEAWLEAHDFSKEEIAQGFHDIRTEYGIRDVISL